MTPEIFWAQLASKQSERESQNYNARSSRLAELIKAGAKLRDGELADVVAECALNGEAMAPDFGNYVANRLARARHSEGSRPDVDRRGRPSVHAAHDRLGAFLFLSRIHAKTAEYCRKKGKPHDPWTSTLPRGALSYAFDALIGTASRPWGTRKLKTWKSVEQAYEAAKKQCAARAIVPRET